MTIHQYAFIKDGIAVNNILFDNPSEELLESFKTEHGVDSIVLWGENPYHDVVGASWDGNQFTAPSPFPSWTLDEQRIWIAPTPYPILPGEITADSPSYVWDEPSLSWIVPN